MSLQEVSARIDLKKDAEELKYVLIQFNLTPHSYGKGLFPCLYLGLPQSRKIRKKGGFFWKKIQIYLSVNKQIRANFSSGVYTYPPVNLFFSFFVCLLVVVALPAFFV